MARHLRLEYEGAIYHKRPDEPGGLEAGQRLGLADGSGLGNLLAMANRRLGANRKLRRVFEKASQIA